MAQLRCTRLDHPAAHSMSVAATHQLRRSRHQHPDAAAMAAASFSAAGSVAKPWHDGVALLSSVRDLPERYTAMLLDQYGCLHDGQRPYAGAVAAVRYLAVERRMRILLLSNSSRRSRGALDKIAALGFDRSWFVGVVTSGEVAHQHLDTRPTLFWQGLGRRVLHFTWASRGAVVLDPSLGLQMTQNAAEADFILAHGTEALAAPGDAEDSPRSVPQLEQLLRRCSGREPPPPMVVANPDFVTTSGDELVTMPGSLGRYYQSLGGKVQLMGKPDPVIYDAARQMLDAAPSSVIAIGDSLEHDIAGAAAAGLDSLFVGGGIHAADLGIVTDGQMLERASGEGTVAQLCEQLGVAAPTFAMPFLTA